MCQEQYNTNKRKFKQLTYKERIKIEPLYNKLHLTYTEIGKIIGKDRTTISRKIKLGLVELETSYLPVWKYCAEVAQRRNEENETAKGNSLQETSRAYIQSVARNSGTYVVGSDETYGYTYKGKVKRISSVVEDDSTYYYLILDGKDEKIFSASYSVSDELSITRDGDIVEISYVDDKNGTIDIIKFDNVAFSTQISEEQQHRNELDEGTSVFDSKSNQVTEVDPEKNEDVWNNMSDEEKAKAISEYMKSVGN